MTTTTNLQKEIWKDIPGFEGKYQVSNLGRVKSFVYRRNKTTIRKLPISNNYYRLLLCKNGKYESFYIHRLIADAFIPNPKNKKYVNHKDGNKLNNDISNLEWVTSAENSHHAWATGLNTKIYSHSKQDAQKVLVLRKEGRTYQEIEDITGVALATAWRIVKGNSILN
jgi:uncharacterized protein YerC